MINEELQEKFEQLASTIDWIKTKIVDLQEEKGLAPIKAPYEVEVPKDIKDYYYVDEIGEINLVEDTFHETDYEGVYQRGLVFKTREEAEQFDKERILINKFKDWTKKYNEGWTPNWKDLNGEKTSVIYDNEYKKLKSVKNYRYQEIIKLPYFKSEEIARQFIEEFGEEIIEVLY